MTEANITLLVIDDDIDFLQWSRCILEAGGYRVLSCSDAETALAEMAHHPPALVMTDLMMKSLDAGFSLAERIKNDPRFAAIPVIIITAAASQRGFDFRPQNPEDLEAMQADAFFCKPVEPKKLLDSIQLLLEERNPAKAGPPNKTKKEKMSLRRTHRE